MQKFLNDKSLTLEYENDWLFQFTSEKSEKIIISKLIEGSFDWSLLEQDPEDLCSSDKNSAAMVLFRKNDNRIPEIWKFFSVDHLKKLQNDSIANYTEEQIKELSERLDSIEENWSNELRERS